MLEITRLTSSDLPAYMQGGLWAIVERDKPDINIIRKMVTDGFKTAGKNHELQNWPFNNSPCQGQQVRLSPARVQKDVKRQDNRSANLPGCSDGFMSSLCGCFGRAPSIDSIHRETDTSLSLCSPSAYGPSALGDSSVLVGHTPSDALSGRWLIEAVLFVGALVAVVREGRVGFWILLLFACYIMRRAFVRR